MISGIFYIGENSNLQGALSKSDFVFKLKINRYCFCSCFVMCRCFKCVTISGSVPGEF